MNLKTNYKEVENKEKQGIELYFDSIPNYEERNELKANGYKWNNAKKCWYKKVGYTPKVEQKVEQAEEIKLGRVPIENSYSGYGWQGVNRGKYSTIKELAQIIRKELKRKYPQCTFSVTIDNRGCCTSKIYVYLMKSTINPFDTYENIIKKDSFINYTLYWARSEKDIEDMKEQLKERLEKNHDTVNEYHLDKEYMLSKFGEEVMQYVKDLCDSFNYDDSDAMTDYYSQGFFTSIGIGKWDKPFELIA